MTDILTPVGRLVYGNLYTPNTKKNNDGSKKIGTDGQDMVSFDYGLAIPKGPEQHWAETEWGQVIWIEGHNAFPNGETRRPDFAWKVHDGDSQIPNKANKRPCDKEGYPGHWVINFSSTYPSKYVNHDGSRVLLDGELIKPGYYVQICGSVVGNKSTQSPGVYMNHSVVSLQSVYEEIQSGGVDAATVGFGQAAMPNGMQRNTLPPPQMGNPTAPPAPPQYQNYHVAPPPQMGNPTAPPAPPQYQNYHVAPPASQTTGAVGAYHAGAVGGSYTPPPPPQRTINPVPGYGTVPPPPGR